MIFSFNIDGPFNYSDNGFMSSKILILFISITLVICIPLNSFELYDGKKIELEMNLLLGMNLSYTATLLPGIGGFEITDGKISFEGEILDKAGFKVSVDLSKISQDSDELQILNDIYGKYDFSDFFRIAAGRFKVPFGRESLMGAASRPNIYHSEGTREISPGRSVGLNFDGKKIFRYFGYNLGFFNESDDFSLENDTGHFLLTGLIFFKNDVVRTGYNVSYTTSESFSQGFFADFGIPLGNDKNLRIFCEYLEQRFFNYHWNHSAFALISYRSANIEPLIYFDYFNERVGFDGDDDKWIAGLGFNSYFLKDKLRLMVDLHTNYYYSLQNSFNLKFYDNKLTIKLLLDI